MAALSIQVPYPVFYDRDGLPLDNGNVYIGIANLDPVTNPLQVYYDEALTIPASQPLKTSNGYLYRNGTPAQIYVDAVNFSILVNDSKNLLVYSFPNGTGISPNASGVEYDPPFTGALTSGYTVAEKLAQYVSVQDFGAVGDGVTDDTAAIQAAIDSGSAKIVGVPGKNYRITDTLTCYTSRLEIDFQQSELLLDDPGGTKSHIFVGDGGVNRVNAVRLNNIVFTRTQVATGGYAVFMNHVGVSSIKNCRVFGDNKIHGGIGVYRGILINIEENYIQDVVLNGIYLEGAGLGADRTLDVIVMNNRVDYGVNGLLTWDFVEGLYCRDNIFFGQATTCVALNASAPANALFSFKLQQNDFDTAAVGFFVDKVSGVQTSDNWISNFSNVGAIVAADAVNVQILDSLIYPQAGATGIETFGSDTLIEGNRVSGGVVCVRVKNVSDRTAVLSNQLSGSTAISIEAAATDVAVRNNTLQVSVAAIVGTGVNSQISQNYGDPSNVGVVSVGASPYTYTTGAYNEDIYIYGGTVSSVVLQGETVATSSNCQISMSPNQTLVITYSSAPTVKRSVRA